MKKLLPIAYIFLVVFIFFWPFVSKMLLPIPADNIVGLYHPFEDFFAKTFTRGIPYKNYLISDPIKQQYPWRELVVALEKKSHLPLWNPYSLSGTPLLANFQSAAFYLFNLLFLFLPFPLGWSGIIILQPLLAAFFLYFYLDNLKLNKWAAAIGAVTFAFCGFFISWLEWGTVLHSGLWLPLILLGIDKIFAKNKRYWFWVGIFILSLSSSFFAGHLQTFFYVVVASFAYLIGRLWQHKKDKKILLTFSGSYSLIIAVIAIQLFPTLQFIQLSARNIDQANWQNNPGWFIPWRHLVQFITPDFFGNPATLNYWSIFNYGEFIGYIGVFPLMMALIAIFFRRDKKTLYFTLLCFISFLFSFPTLISKLPFILKIPLLSTSQPTRLMFLIDFSLAVLSALGFDYYLKNRKKILLPLIIFLFILLTLWIFVFTGNHLLKISAFNLNIARHNLYLPSVTFIVIFLMAILGFFNENKKIKVIFLIGLLAITAFDLLRFASKYTPFITIDFIFPQTKTLTFLRKNLGLSRIATSDAPVFPPNFSVIFRLQSVDGYDPLYLKRYAEFIAALERGKPDISEPFEFNKIITPHNFESKFIDLLGAKYILSRTDIKSQKLIKVFQEGKTRVYENPHVFPRVFFAQKTICLTDKKQVIREMFKDTTDLHQIAFIEDKDCSNLSNLWSDGKTKISLYSENKIIIETENAKEGFLVFIDSFYPTWSARIFNNNDKAAKNVKIYLTDFNFRGVIVPAGKNIIEFYITLL
ncbi:MAG: hypothetical protein HW400_494 [Candidatus Levybacteria bacterium]|nr:hypothetical protein [Candidatus Levybacteria bacterium]